jgi:hypothetical protein
LILSLTVSVEISSAFTAEPKKTLKTIAAKISFFMIINLNKLK